MIVVVDDDVGFAEELQDLLMLHGHRAVVVVTHPQASSLILLSSARLLILDLSLDGTTALGVLEDLHARGGSPAVVIVSGSGAETLERARLTAIERGFHILGALPKPVAPEMLLRLIALYDSSLPLKRDLEGLEPQTEPRAVSHLQIVRAGSLEHRGLFLTLGNDTDPDGIVPRAMGMQRSLGIHGREGFVVVCLLEQVLANPAAIKSICASAEHTHHLRDKIVFDLGLRGADYHDSASQLRAAGFGQMVEVDDAGGLEKAAHGLPVTMVAIAADRVAAAQQDGMEEALQQALLVLRSRSILTLCTEVRSLSDLGLARAFGFDLVAITN